MAMGRPREFDLDRALDQALEVFWRNGYEGSSIAELTEAMGINPPSLYAAFGNKEGLFRRALDRYTEQHGRYWDDALAAPTPSVIAAAGGIVLGERNRVALKASDAYVVWLLADVDVLLQRVRNGGHRPLLDDDPEGTLRRMFVEREALYREVASAIVSVDHRSVNDVAQAVLRCRA